LVRNANGAMVVMAGATQVTQPGVMRRVREDDALQIARAMLY
jgi:hypothetical protein